MGDTSSTQGGVNRLDHDTRLNKVETMWGKGTSNSMKSRGEARRTIAGPTIRYFEPPLGETTRTIPLSTTMTMKILVIEDEKKVASFIQQGLREEHYEIDLAYDGDEGLEKAVAGEYDGIILDLMLPGRDGISVLRELRGRGDNTPVLILTAKGTTQDKITGLDSGADDYLAKPFHFEELTARIRSLLRRSSVEKTTQVKVGDLVLDTISRKAKRGTQEIELTTREYALLEYLMRNNDRVLSRSVITQHVWNYNFAVDSNLVDVYVNRLRNKIEANGAPRIIHSIRGVGYIMREGQPDEEPTETEEEQD